MTKARFLVGAIVGLSAAAIVGLSAAAIVGLSAAALAVGALAAPGDITTVAGTADVGDGGPADSATLRFPFGVALDGSGNLFIADAGTNRIRRVDSATGFITTVAGTGTRGFSDDGGPATNAELSFPSGVALDAVGNLFITDSSNDRVRRVDVATGVITTVAGTGTRGFSGDGGPATSATLRVPSGVALDASGNLFIADKSNGRIRRVDSATGVIITVAGTSTSGFSGRWRACHQRHTQGP